MHPFPSLSALRWFAWAVVACSACASRQPLAERSEAAVPEIAVPEDGSKLIFAGQARGVQIYDCAARPQGGFEWKLKAPEATVISDSGEELRHSAGPSWEARDGSKAVGEVKKRAQVDAAAIPWLLLAASSTGAPGLLGHARWVQRLDTHGGKAPAGGCDAVRSGAEVRVDYSAVYRVWGE